MSSFTYKVNATRTAGPYTFNDVVLKDDDRNSHASLAAIPW